MNDTFVAAPVLMIGVGVMLVVTIVIAGITIVRCITRRFDD